MENKDSYKETLGGRIEKRQRELHLNDVYIANEVGVSKVSVGKWRRNDSEPSGVNLEKLAGVLKTTTDYLLYGDTRSLVSLADVGIPFFESVDIGFRPDLNVVHREVEERMVSINRDIAKAAGADIDSCFSYVIDDDGMSDRIAANSICVADSSKTEVRDGKIYCFRHGVIRRTRYLYRLTNGGLLIKSHDASRYPDEVIDPEKLDDIEIYGWVWQWSVSERW